MSGDIWTPGTFWVAMAHGPDVRSGYVMRGLGLAHDGWATPKQNTRWSLTHIGSGSMICKMQGTVSMVMPVASKIARCGDWTLFDLPDGWQQTDPDLPTKVWAILEAWPGVAPTVGGRSEKTSDDEARAVIAAREALA